MRKEYNYKNILVVRTDRIGDVVLTTPAIEALRVFYPNARISILVTPQTKDIVEENPFLDEVIVYDMKGKNRGFLGFWSFVFDLRKRKFDLAINYHLKKRTNSLLFHAGIPARIGFKNKKLGFLLTRQFPDPRINGLSHEFEYCLDLLKYLGVDISSDYHVLVSIKKESEQWVKKIFEEKDISLNEKIVVVHPGASCISKRWSADRFAEIIDLIYKQYNVKTILIGAKDNRVVSDRILSRATAPVIDLTGQTTISQLISVLKQSCLLISNDSGPVHLAVGVKTPVISIFGRNQLGLSVRRWRPLGERDISLHKDIGCTHCLAHNCEKDFQCLKAITVDNVFEVVKKNMDYLFYQKDEK